MFSATFLPLRSATRLQRAVLGHKDRFGFRRRRLVADIDERRPGSLREDRRRFARRAEIDGADIERLEQLRPGRELGPLDRIALRLQLFLEQSLRLQQDERAVLLEADADVLSSA